MKLARTKNTMRNTLWGAIYRLVAIMGPFMVKTIMIKRLGLEYSGLNSLFTDILTVLNLANLGFSSTLVFTMYQAVAEDDKRTLCAIMAFFRKAYRIVGMVFLGLGALTMPFLNVLVGDGCPANLNLYILFSVYLIETAMDYLLFGYTTALPAAYQRTDVTMRISTLRFIVQYILQIGALLIFDSYYAYLLVLPLVVLPNNIANYLAARKMYPDIRPRGTLDPGIKRNVFLRIRALLGHKIGSTVLTNSGAIVISSFLGLTAQSLYSNYYYILRAVNNVVEILTNGILAGIGNKMLTDSREDNHRLFLNLSYGWMGIIGFCAACMLCLYQPFIGGIWLGEEYLLPMGTVIFIVLFFYSWMFRLMQLTYRDAAGIWTKDWLKPYVGTALSLLGSIGLVKLSGSMIGVLLPTIFVMFFVYTPWEAYVLYRYQFQRSIRPYVLKVISYIILTLLGCVLSYAVSLKLMPENSLTSFLVRLPIVTAVFAAVWLAGTCRTEEFQYWLHWIHKMIRRR